MPTALFGKTEANALEYFPRSNQMRENFTHRA
jgi:hypothetical protein